MYDTLGGNTFSEKLDFCLKQRFSAECFGSHFSHIGLINQIFWPSFHILVDASLDTHINMTYVRHQSDVSADRYRI